MAKTTKSRPDHISQLPAFPNLHPDPIVKRPTSKLGLILSSIVIIVWAIILTCFVGIQQGLIATAVLLAYMVQFAPVIAFPIVLVVLALLVVQEQRSHRE